MFCMTHVLKDLYWICSFSFFLVNFDILILDFFSIISYLKYILRIIIIIIECDAFINIAVLYFIKTLDTKVHKLFFVP